MTAIRFQEVKRFILGKVLGLGALKSCPNLAQKQMLPNEVNLTTSRKRKEDGGIR